MKISILDAQHVIFEGAVSEAILPAVDGELSILDDHEPIFIALSQGYIRLRSIARKVVGGGKPEQGTESTGEIKPIFIHQGLARMKNNELLILAE